MAAEWRSHEPGRLNVEARCPQKPERLVIIPQPLGKFDWATSRANLGCPCCPYLCFPDSVTQFFVNDVLWGYKGTLEDGTVIADKGKAGDDIISVLDGQRGWKTLIFATADPIPKFNCFKCKQDLPTEGNCNVIRDKEVCNQCLANLMAEKRAQENAERRRKEALESLEQLSQQHPQRTEIEQNRRQRIEDMRETGGDQDLDDLPNHNFVGSAHIDAHLARVDRERENLKNRPQQSQGYNSAPAAPGGAMKRGGPPPPGGSGPAMARGGPPPPSSGGDDSGGMKRGGPPAPPMARGGPPPPPAPGGRGGLPKKKYERGTPIADAPKKAAPPKPQGQGPGVSMNDILAVQLNRTAPRGGKAPLW